LSISTLLFAAQFSSILDAYRSLGHSIKYGGLFLVLVFTYRYWESPTVVARDATEGLGGGFRSSLDD
jgi:hypothetical protein